MGPQTQWVQRYVTRDKIYFVYIAPSGEMIHEHALRSGFPANPVSEVTAMVGTA